LALLPPSLLCHPSIARWHRPVENRKNSTAAALVLSAGLATTDDRAASLSERDWTVLADLHRHVGRFGFSSGAPVVPNTNPTRQRGFCCIDTNTSLWLTEPSLALRVSMTDHLEFGGDQREVSNFSMGFDLGASGLLPAKPRLGGAPGDLLPSRLRTHPRASRPSLNRASFWARTTAPKLHERGRSRWRSEGREG